MGFLSKLFKRKPRTERVRVSLESVRIANDRMMARKRPPQQHHTGCSIAAEGGERCQTRRVHSRHVCPMQPPMARRERKMADEVTVTIPDRDQLTQDLAIAITLLDRTKYSDVAKRLAEHSGRLWDDALGVQGAGKTVDGTSNEGGKR